MIGASLLPARFRKTDSGKSTPPSWFNRKVTSIVESLSGRACTHPIHTIVFVALLASTTYIGLLEGSLFDHIPSSNHLPRRADLPSLLEGSRVVRAGEDTAWKWQIEDQGFGTTDNETMRHLAVSTLVFPGSLSARSAQTAPLAHEVHLPNNSSAKLLPTTLNPLSPLSQDSTLAFFMPYDEASAFLSAVQEIPDPASGLSETREQDPATEEKRWIMRAARGDANAPQWTLRRRVSNAWNEFVDLLKNADSLDIFIVTLGYILMHLTFVSLFLSMRRMGSNFWLAATVLCSSVFAFLFGLTVTTKLGVPMNMVLLSEGLPFLVITIGFEKPILLTKAVLSASLNARRHAPQSDNASRSQGDYSPNSILYAVQIAVKDKGFEIVRDYFVEIVILIGGAVSGVQGGLRQFCFLAAWILAFDCLLLFTFYTAILCIKLEINRIKRHVALRKALEDDGVSRKVAENVASSNDWPRFKSGTDEDRPSSTFEGFSIFGRKVKDSSVPTFKVLMVSGFVLINILNLCTIPFRATHQNGSPPTVSGLSSVVIPPPMDPFKVAGNGLHALLKAAKVQKITTVVTVLPPIKYALEYPSVHYAPSEGPSASILEIEYADQFLDSVGGRIMSSVLKSLESPLLSKWIILALAMSLFMNGYLFNAARWSFKDLSDTSGVDGTTRRPAARQLPLAPVDTSDKAAIDHHTNGKAISSTETIVGEQASEAQPSGDARTFEECDQMVKDKKAMLLTDAELVELSLKGKIPGYALEKTLGDKTRAVKVRRMVVSRTPSTMETTALLAQSLLPYENYNYDLVHGACCENVIGYMPLPVGIAGPVFIDGRSYFLPMATTEGVLVASTSRGCKAINAGGGAFTVLTGDGMTRGPCIGFPTVSRAGEAKLWIDSEEGQNVMRKAFNSTSRFARLQSMKTALAGTYLYIRFKTTTGDAMGMNMISKGVENALAVMSKESGFDDMSIISVSGNFCIDKKPAAINWVDGRGKSVVAEAIIPGDVVKSVLKSDVDALVELNISKNLIGSAMAGSIGGFNAHAANIVTAIFLATGQDPAQNVESSNCITVMKNLNGNLQISVSMPSIEVGTIGGGTVLEPQSAMLDLLGVRGSHPINPGDNARQLARIVAAGVLAGELSLCSALAAGHLVKSHMAHNRSAAPSRAATPVSAAIREMPGGIGRSAALALTAARKPEGR
ncbi:hmg-CoA reductase [Xylona heveae TC161]|uniref:3-hydroxy-3-methylglutaryl coenzyme A reductase n=1 Tax=Xylona heveae (strain CBS 132557 / TC161) TaxID=1328760 RepID=A0A165I5L8_XYLHT|nr:hmg-CoA reductase [Xylona heveae TC161]KZF24420.1 hmg-CoA reductase [Xylona heveae TC161]